MKTTLINENGYRLRVATETVIEYGREKQEVFTAYVEKLKTWKSGATSWEQVIEIRRQDTDTCELIAAASGAFWAIAK